MLEAVCPIRQPPVEGAIAQRWPPRCVMPKQRFGPVDLMSANAGVARLGDIGRQAPADWDEMIAINVNGVMNSVHAVMSGMMERRHGRLVMMSSIAWRKVYPDHTVHCGTKYFVHGVSESLRE